MGADGDDVIAFGDEAAKSYGHITAQGGSIAIDAEDGNDLAAVGSAAQRVTVALGDGVYAGSTGGLIEATACLGNGTMTFAYSFAEFGAANIQLNEGDDSASFGSYAGAKYGTLNLDAGDGGDHITLDVYTSSTNGTANIAAGTGDDTGSVGENAAAMGGTFIRFLMAQPITRKGFACKTRRAITRRECRSMVTEPPRVYRMAKLSENCPLWNRHQRREPRSRIHLSSASVRFGWRWNTAMSIKAKPQR